jgi:hypothetical protein
LLAAAFSSEEEEKTEPMARVMAVLVCTASACILPSAIIQPLSLSLAPAPAARCDKVDWRERGAITPAKNQGALGKHSTVVLSLVEPSASYVCVKNKRSDRFFPLLIHLLICHIT